MKTYVTADATDVGLMSALTKCPVSVAIKADMVTFQLYKAGVYSSSQCEDTETMELDHGKLMHQVVSIVGPGLKPPQCDSWLMCCVLYDFTSQLCLWLVTARRNYIMKTSG